MAGAGGPVTVREVLVALRPWGARIAAGDAGLGRGVTWASAMRARLPAFEGLQGGELALLSLGTLRSLRAQIDLTLPAVVDQLAETGASAIAVAGLGAAPDDSRGGSASDDDLDTALARANAHAIPLLALPAGTNLAEIERAVIAHIVARRDRPPAATEPADAYAARERATLRDEALDVLLTGTYPAESQMRARARSLGFDLAQPHAVLWVEASDPRVAATLAEPLADALGAWARARDGEVVAVVPVAADDAGLAGTAAHCRSVLVGAAPGGMGEIPWCAGLGGLATGPAEVRRSAGEAHDAVRLGRGLLGAGHVARAEDLGLYRLLLALRDAGELAPFVGRTLAPLLADARAGDALIETLDAFFACNGNLSEAARRLHLHRNSLLYRLHRARELLATVGKDLDDAEQRLTLQLAIYGRRVLDL